MKGTTKNNSQKEGLLNLLASLPRAALPLINVLTQLAKNVFMPLGLSATASPTKAAIQKKSLDQDIFWI